MLYLAIGPFFVAARNGAVAFDIAIKPFLGADTNQQLVLGVFTVLFFAISYWLSVSPGKLVGRVGKVLTSRCWLPSPFWWCTPPFIRWHRCKLPRPTTPPARLPKA